ncbi:MAG: pentapeptide repeat-containing protein [Spirulina sp. SIO3F2]|nr:pentapeptide repeat-containing protein [Spirulina sp. SIO3F2]
MNLKELRHLYATGKRDFGALNLNEANLRNVNLSGGDFTGATLNVANLSGANLSEVQLNGAKLNVARLSAANLYRASINQAKLNVANLIRADLREAEIIESIVLHSELVRADLSGANLSGSNFSGTDFREASLRQANLSYCNLSESNLRDVLFEDSTLEQANLNGADLTRANLRAVNLRDADLNQACLTRANLSGADLRGANLRWADLSGANLRWADLSNARLSGANLMGADLSDANLVNASLVHADLSRVRLMKAEWTGADLTGATLTGARLYQVGRTQLNTQDLVCEWVDLSPMGDETMVQHFKPQQVQAFFNEKQPTVQITVDAAFNLYANLALATLYHQITQAYPRLHRPPSINVSSRRTYLTFAADRNADLFVTAYCAMLPFQDAQTVEAQLHKMLEQLQRYKQGVFKSEQHQQLVLWDEELNQLVERLHNIKQEQANFLPPEALDFLDAPIYIVLTNSNDRSIDMFQHPQFGKRLPNAIEQTWNPSPSQQAKLEAAVLPPINVLVQFIQDFFHTEVS